MASLCVSVFAWNRSDSVFARRIQVSFSKDKGSLEKGSSISSGFLWLRRANQTKKSSVYPAGSSSRFGSKSSRTLVRLLRSPRQSFVYARQWIRRPSGQLNGTLPTLYVLAWELLRWLTVRSIASSARALLIRSP